LTSFQHNDIIVFVIPSFESNGHLPPGVHPATWQEFVQRFGTTPHRKRLLIGLQAGLQNLRAAGCCVAYVDGSFVTDKEASVSEPPQDFDVCWEAAGVDPTQLDPVLLTFSAGRAIQKAKYRGEFFPAHVSANRAGMTFFDFFQIDKATGHPKGIVALDLPGLP
jgi:hypothetical protein